VVTYKQARASGSNFFLFQLNEFYNFRSFSKLILEITKSPCYVSEVAQAKDFTMNILFNVIDFVKCETGNLALLSLPCTGGEVALRLPKIVVATNS